MVFSVLLGCDKEDLLKVEQFFLDVYNPWFNIYKTAGSPWGHKKSEETKRKISETEKKMGYKNHLGKTLINGYGIRRKNRKLSSDSN